VSRFGLAASLLVLLAVTSGCRRGELYQQTEELMGTVFSVKVWSGGCCPGKAVEEAVEGALDEARRIESLMSEYRDDSALSRINALAGKEPVKVDDLTWHVIEAAVRMGRDTGGAFDITFAPLGKLWSGAQKKKVLPSKSEIDGALALVGLDNLVLDAKAKTVFLEKPGCRIGLGGVAKGFAMDRMASILEERGIHDFILYGGGDLLVSGSKGGEPWELGVQHPRKRGELLARFSVDGRWAVATSGDYERFFIVDGVRCHHIVDPKTGMPASKTMAVTVMARTAMTADALATALFVMGPQAAADHHAPIGDFKALVIDPQMKLHRLGDFPDLVMMER
jgi:thiamine biosynthesis lipoprotein